MDEDLIVTQIGLIFSQVRYLRMALDQVERSTARYAGVALDVAAAGPHRWGAPPLEGGALRVFVINIGDLIAGDNSFLGVLSSAFRLATSAIGGLVGGAISGLALPVILAEIAEITRNALQILKLIGLTGDKDTPKSSGPQQSGTLLTFFDRLERTARTIGEIFGIANSQQANKQPPAGPDGAVWLQTMMAVEQIVKGLILLVPNLIGALAVLIVRIDGLKPLLLSLFEFAVRNMLILRGVVLLTLYDTIAAAARLAGALLNIIAAGIGSILDALFRILNVAVTSVIEAIKFLAGALKAAVDALLPWLVGTVFGILNGLGRLPIFRMMFAVVEMMPVLLPVLLRLTFRAPLSSKEQKSLEDARDNMVKGLAASSTPPPMPAKMPSIATLPDVDAAFKGIAKDIRNVTDSMQTEIPGMIHTAGGLLGNVAVQMQNAIGPGGANLNRGIQAGVGAVTNNAKTLADELQKTQAAAVKAGGTGLEKIADAYEQWLKGGGLKDIMDGLQGYFKASPEASAVTLGPAATAGAQPVEPPRPTVEIKEVVVEITAAAEPASHVRAAAHKTAALDTLDPDEELPWAERYARGDFQPAWT